MTTLDIIDIAFVLFLVFSFARFAWVSGYESGQTDMLKGKQKWKLIEFPDGTRGFYYKPKPEDFTKDYKDFKIIK